MRARTPSPQALLRVANYLYTNDLGVRVWDLIELACEGRGLTAYVVEHLSGPAPSHANHAAFLRRLTDLCQSGPLETPHGKFERAADFAAPNCNGNLLVDQRSGAALYVDFQGFQLIDERKILLSRAEHARSWSHFGGTRLRRGNRPYLYQALPGLVPGKRDTASRWQLFHEILAKSEIDLEGRVVFDVGCNMGLMLYGALSEGALWACGWDMPDVVKEARGLLFSLGATRFTLTPGVITDQTDFAAGLPPHLTGSTEGVLFYLAVYRHIGFPEGLARLPWRYMVFEGHGDEDLENVLAYVNRIPCLEPVEVLSSRMVADGDSPPRPLLLVRRSG